jgi:hypothetical protein
MTTAEYLWTLLLGFVLGWTTYSILLQIAYRMGIVEYKGTKK